MGRPLQQDEQGRIMGDTETEKNQKGYSNYEADLAKKQTALDAKDQKTKDTYMGILKGGMNILSSPMKKPDGMKKGGKVGSASKRADGCCVKGKTKGKML